MCAVHIDFLMCRPAGTDRACTAETHKPLKIKKEQIREKYMRIRLEDISTQGAGATRPSGSFMAFLLLFIFYYIFVHIVFEFRVLSLESDVLVLLVFRDSIYKRSNFEGV
jgi:hypothetical protein